MSSIPLPPAATVALDGCGDMPVLTLSPPLPSSPKFESLLLSKLSSSSDQLLSPPIYRSSEDNDASVTPNGTTSVVIHEALIDQEDLSSLLEQGNKTGRLCLSNWCIDDFPAQILDMTSLTSLDISANNLRTLPSNLGQLSSLRKLSVNHNHLANLPASLFTITTLTALYVNNNRLKSLSGNIRNLSNLRTLDLSCNFLSELPLQLCELPSLAELRIRNNRLESLPRALASMPALKSLSLTGNPLQYAAASGGSSPTQRSSVPTVACHPTEQSSSNNVPKRRVAHKRKFSIDLNVPISSCLPKRPRQQSEERRNSLSPEENLSTIEILQALLKEANEKLRGVTIHNTSMERLIPYPTQALPPHPQIQQYPVSSSSADRDELFCRIQPSEVTFKRQVGRGSYGEVWLGTWRNTTCAIKKLFPDLMNKKLLENLREEVNLLCKLRHPNVVLFLGAYLHESESFIVMEYLARGNLAQILANRNILLQYSLRLQMLTDVALGINYLHTCSPPIIHRDLKSENLLVDENWQVKVADFGLAMVMKTRPTTNCGTVGYAAPEVLCNKPYSTSADVYSFGVIMWEMFTRQIPYKDYNSVSIIRSIDQGETLPFPPECPPGYVRLIQSCWQLSATQRPSMNLVIKCLEHLYSQIDLSDE